MAFLTDQSWRALKSWYSDRGPEQGFQRCLADGPAFSFVSGADYLEASQLRESFQNAHQYR